MTLSFEWDSNKNKSNIKKHGISFEEARSVFLDENAIEYYDIEHSMHEDRYLMLGLSNNARILLVSYAVQKIHGDITIRIISARKATKKERINYRGKEHEKGI
jgi:hypothetical protein